MSFFAKMNTFSILTLALVVLFAVAVLGAPSNSTSSQGNKKPLSSSSTPAVPPRAKSPGAASSRSGNATSHQSFFIQGAATSTSKTPAAAATNKKSASNSTRVTREVNADGVEQGISEGRSDIVKSASSSSGNKKVNSTRVAREVDSDEIDNADARSSLPSSNRKSNSTSSTSHREIREDEDALKSTSNSSQQFVPSTHPLFANRQSSNITKSLKPKLRGTGSPVGGSSDSSSEEDKSGTSQAHQSSKKNQNKDSSSEENVSVISSGPVAVQSTKNPSRPGIGSRRASTTSTTHTPIEDEVAVFVF